MNTPRYAAAAAGLLRRYLPGRVTKEGDPERAAATIERALRARWRRRQLRWSVAAVAVAAGLVLVTQLARRYPADAPAVMVDVSPLRGGAAIQTGQSLRTIAEPTSLTAGQSVETPANGAASLRFSTGSVMELAGSTSIKVESSDAIERFLLGRGQLSAKVAKLSSGQRLIVATPDAEIEVRGTAFRVRVLDAVEACHDSKTRLTVSEGVVEVRAGGQRASVVAGSVWPSSCDNRVEEAARDALAEQAAPARVPAEPKRPAEPKHVGASHSDSAPASSTPEPSSSLARQNDLFAQGVALRQQGDVSGALRTYAELIERFPASPLAENAMVQRMRLLAARHDPHVREEARRYLARYPRGFAASEAAQLSKQP